MSYTFAIYLYTAMSNKYVVYVCMYVCNMYFYLQFLLVVSFLSNFRCHRNAANNWCWGCCVANRWHYQLERPNTFNLPINLLKVSSRCHTTGTRFSLASPASSQSLAFIQHDSPLFPPSRPLTAEAHCCWFSHLARSHICLSIMP